MNSVLLSQLKEQAMEKVHSHGAFGEHEYYLKVDLDKFAELIIADCTSVCYSNAEKLHSARLNTDDFEEKNRLTTGELTAVTIAKEILEKFQ
jgi:hypothetical protein